MFHRKDTRMGGPRVGGCSLHSAMPLSWWCRESVTKKGRGVWIEMAPTCSVWVDHQRFHMENPSSCSTSSA